MTARPPPGNQRRNARSWESKWQRAWGLCVVSVASLGHTMNREDSGAGQLGEFAVDRAGLIRLASGHPSKRRSHAGDAGGRGGLSPHMLDE